MNEADPSDAIVSHSLRTRFEDIPQYALTTVKHAVIDTVGAALAGLSTPIAHLVRSRAQEIGGVAESFLFFTNVKIPFAEAGFANAVLARCAELDDVHEGSPRARLGHAGHVNVVIVPAALAALELIEKPVSGREFLTAIAIGGDVLARVRLAGGNAGRNGWEGPTFAPFGVVASVGRLLGLDADQMRNALGPAYAQCAGNILSTTDGGWDVWLNAGTAVRAGLLAVDLAHRGFVGAKSPFTGKSGLFDLYFRGEYHPEALLGQLGSYFESANVSVKPYASCKASHHAIYTAAKLAEDNQIRAEDVSQIVIGASSYTMRLVAQDLAGNPKMPPSSPSEAQFNLAYLLALVLVRGAVYPEDIVEGLSDKRVRDLASLVRIDHLAEKDELQKTHGYPPTDVSITTRQGAVYAGCEDYVKGHPENPMSTSDVAEKFLGCAQMSDHGIDSGRLHRFLETADRIETMTDVRGLHDILVPPAGL